MLRRSVRAALALALALPAALAFAAAPADAAATTYQAESATLVGGAVVGADHTGYTGTGFVGGYTDANKGNASTTFSVSAATAGSYTLGLRYADGTGSPRTLSLAVDGGAAQQISLPATTNWDSWSTQTVTISLTAGSHAVAYKFGSSDTGNANLDSLTLTGPASTGGGGTSNGGYEAENAALSGGAVAATDHTGYTGSGFVSGYTDANKGNATTTFTLNATSAGNYALGLRYANGTGVGMTLSLSVDGQGAQQIALPATTNWDTWSSQSTTVALSAGNHTVAYRFGSSDSGNVNLDSLTVTAVAAPPPPTGTRGATLPYTEYEAEAGQSTGSVLAPNRTYSNETSEASGRRAVRLSATGQYVKITLTAATNSLVVRFCIPDSADGTGQTQPLSLYAGSTRLTDLSLSSTYSWLYGDSFGTNDPSKGLPHRFFDETHVLIGSWPAGTVLTLQKDAGDNAAYYDIDLIDTEQVAPAGTQPSGSVSLASYGATANDGTDDTNAFTSAVSAAQGKTLWIPAGTFNINSRINLANVTVTGAGMWYSTLRGTNGKGGLFATGSNVHISNLFINGDNRYRNDSAFDTGIEGNFGSSSGVSAVWIEHTKVGMWIDSGTRGLTVTGMRIRDTFADGVNIHADVQDSSVAQSSFRGTGDDALAMFSEGAPVTRCSFVNDTVQLPLLGNGIGIYGGNGNSATNDTVTDTVYADAGLAVSTRFNPVPFSGTTTVSGVTMTRTGGYEPVGGKYLAGLLVLADTSNITTPVAISYLDILDSTRDGILLRGTSSGRTITGLTLDHVTVNGAGYYGINTDTVTGSATLSYVTVIGASAGGLNNPAGYTFNRGAGNSGF